MVQVVHTITTNRPILTHIYYTFAGRCYAICLSYSLMMNDNDSEVMAMDTCDMARIATEFDSVIVRCKGGGSRQIIAQ